MEQKIEPTTAQLRSEQIKAFRDVAMMVALLAAAVTFAVLGFEGLAATTLGAAVTGGLIATTRVARSASAGSALVLAGGLGAAALFGGCTPVQLAAAHGTAMTIARTTCGVVQHAADVCRDAGLSPGESCPMPIAVDRLAVDVEIVDGAPEH